MYDEVVKSLRLAFLCNAMSIEAPPSGCSRHYPPFPLLGAAAASSRDGRPNKKKY
jgi:hypothetical protein